MDMDLFKTDLEREAKKLPPELLEVMHKLATHFGPMLDKVIPDMFASLNSHIRVIFMEVSMGMLDKKELEQVITEVLDKVKNGKGA